MLIDIEPIRILGNRFGEIWNIYADDEVFSSRRIILQLNTVILGEQAELTEPVREAITSILGIDASSLQVINRPPTRSKPIYMKVWEARKADGLDYDPDDERQQAFLSEITKYNIRSIE